MNIKLYKYENNNFILQAIIDDSQGASFEHNLYQAGTFTITINYNIPNAKLFERGLFVQFGDNPYDFGEIISVNNTIGSDGKGSEFINVTGYDARYLFKRRVIKNLNNNDTWSMTAKGELCMRNLVADQCGTNAETKRQLPIINTIPLAADAIGSTYSVSESFSNLYDVLVTIATQSEIGWAVLFENGTLTLHVYKGSDLSSSVQFSTDFESLANGNYKDSSESFANSIYIGGKGTGSERDIYEGEDGTPEGIDRFEAYDNQSSMTTEDEYEAEALSMLSQYGQTVSMSGAGLAKCPYIFREQYNIGDIVKLSFSGKSANVQILSVTEVWQWNRYGITFNFGKPVNTINEQLNLILRKIQEASNKNKACESVKWYNVATDTAQSASEVIFNTIGFTGVIPSGGRTFTLYRDDEGTGAKSYMVYTKNLTGTDALTLTTGVTGASTATITAGNKIINLLVDTDGNIIKNEETTTEIETGSTVGSLAVDGTDVQINGVDVIQDAGNAGAVCTTSENTNAKAIDITNFNFYNGATIKVCFTKGNKIDNPMLSIGGSSGGYIPIVFQSEGKLYRPKVHTGYWRGSSTTSSEMWQPYTTLELMYLEGTQEVYADRSASTATQVTGGVWLIVGNPVVESYYTSNKGYSVYADGKIEQWAFETPTTEGWTTVNLKINFSNNYPTIIGHPQYGDSADANERNTIQVRMFPSYITAQNFKYYAVPTWGTYTWKAIGY